MIFGLILTLLFILSIIDGSDSMGFIIFVVVIDLIIFMTCKVLKKHVEKLIIEINKIKTSQAQQGFKELNVLWNIDEATNVYCTINNKNEDSLDDDDEQMIFEYARVDLAFLTTWLIDNDFYSTQNNEVKSAIKEVKARKLDGNDFVAGYCDEKLVRSDIASVIVDFFDNYIVNNFEHDYKNFVEQELNKKMYGFSFSWEDYEKFRLMIDNVYNKSFEHDN